MKRNDKQLILDCRRGDQTAWEVLVHRYQRLIYAVPRRAGLDEDQAAEVFQEVFTTLFQKLDDIDDPERLHAWLVTAARRKTWRSITRNRQMLERTGDSEDQDEELFDVPDDAPLADEMMVQLEEQHRIRLALDRLDQRCQDLLRMLFYEDEVPAYSVIAARLGTPEGSIGPTRARCLEKLLRSFGARGPKH
jgi:RNA polymerase sigma factor (sigma-70 family)